MPLPAAITSRTLTKQCLRADGTPASGYVTFTPSITAHTAGYEITAQAVTVRIDDAGDLQATVAATDDPDWLAPGWVYHVVEVIDGIPVSTYDIEVPYQGTGEIDLATLAPVVDPDVVTPYVLQTRIGAVNGVAGLDGTGRVPAEQLPASSGGDPDWDDIQNKPSTFPPATPIAQSSITNLVTDLAAIDGRLDDLEAAPGGGSSVQVDFGHVTSGSVTPQTTASFAAVTGGPTASIAAAVGDKVEFSWSGLLDNASGLFYDICVIVGGAAVRYASSGTSTPAVEGDPGMYQDTVDFRPQNTLGMALTVASGDLSGGTITFGLAVLNPSGGGQIYASTAFPWRWMIRNYGS